MDKEGFEAILTCVRDSPHQWIVTDWRMIHTPTDIVILIHYGPIGYQLWQPTGARFTMRQKWRFYRVFKRWRGWYVRRQLIELRHGEE